MCCTFFQQATNDNQNYGPIEHLNKLLQYIVVHKKLYQNVFVCKQNSIYI